MARKTIVIDDLDGGEDAREVTFSLDGETWRIDLSERNRQRLRAALGEFIEAGVKVGGVRSRATAGHSGSAAPSGSETSVNFLVQFWRVWQWKQSYFSDAARCSRSVKYASRS